ncbi:MAG: ImmA/IrrE family metallo-endopeptidase [Rhodobacter sp.]|nr:ImmA/IrrE family metallo-endopeptidase [Rhodobacter sp.]MCA3462236.1 ImmA/IrrE family metallo-endopeptidase [Rhodobacter sp.]MCA3465658.1 ImmA/IrrE family metallo-endopeptidase [Rhodobacter sp.]MCA3468963.1 ImmA/IrrE family metallo-endopeptidase [Rhodobacter sp.]MCA3472120.1 ImmA/IrrE family metallo-endopeptidase [Rhodobacter sp.]
MEKFNRHMLALARDSRGLTQIELASTLGVKQGTVSKYESGLLEPPEDYLDEVSGALGYRRTFFFETGRPYGMPPFHYRKRKKLSVKALSRIVAEMNIRRMHVATLLRSYEIKSNGFIPEIERDEYVGRAKVHFSVEDVARRMREQWMLPQGPIQSMVDVVESAGGIVVPCDFGSDLLDAMSQRIDGMPVLFFVNVNAPGDRARHTLAHELGHMLLHTREVLADDEMEDEADAFAGAFLLPAHEIRPQLRQFNIRQLSNMKGYWKVSMAAIAVRASRLNLITPYQRKSFWIEMSRLGYRKREPNEPAKETPSLLRKMLDYHVSKLGYSIEELSSVLHVTTDEFFAMYGSILTPSGSERLKLRVIK